MINATAPRLLSKIRIYKRIARCVLAIAACAAISLAIAAKSAAVISCRTCGLNESVSSVETAVRSYIQLPMTKLSYTPEDTETPADDSIIMDLSRQPYDGKLYISNETGYTPDLEALLEAPYPIERHSVTTVGTVKTPLVLILHTHGTEAYADDDTRSSDITRNVVSVGALMAQILNDAGVPTLHCEVMHDKESYLNSYNRSKETILSYIKEYPSIQYIFDVHRDAVFNSAGEAVKPLTEIGGKNVAQVMSVVGTDYKGANHPDWELNLNLAVKLQYALNTKYENIARPINLRSASFHGQYAAGSLLLEIGSCANTLAEAERAAIITAETLAELILNN